MAFVYILQSEATPYIRRSTFGTHQDIRPQKSVV